MNNCKKAKTIFIVYNLLILLSLGQGNILQVEQITTKDGLPQNSVQSIKQDKFGFIWLSSFASICKYDGYKFIQYYPEPDNPKTIISSGIYNMVIDSLENLWIGFFSTTTYCKYNYETDDFFRISEINTPDQIVQKMQRSRQPIYFAENTSDVTWRYENGYIFKKDLNTNIEKKYCLDLSGTQQLTSGLISAIYLDKFGVLWIGTENQGVYKINTNTKPFYSIYNSENTCDRFINDIIRKIYEDENGILWLGTYSNGLIKFDRKRNTIKCYKHNPQNPAKSIVDNQIRAIMEDSYGEIWIGTKGGVTRYNPRTDEYKSITRTTPFKIPSPWVHTFCEDHEGIIWIGTFYGFVRFDRENNEYIAYDPTKILKSYKVSKIIEDKNYNLWISTQGGGITCLKRTEQIDIFDTLHYGNIPGNPVSLTSNRVFNLLEDDKGYIWASTDLGLNRLNIKTGEVKRITIKEGLPDDMIMGMLDDKNNNLWISHKKGLSKINMQNFKMQHFSKQDGLQSNNFAENSCFRNPKTGEMFFGNLYGLNSFFPDSIKINKVEPYIYFTEIKVLNQNVSINKKINNRVIIDKSLLYTDKITLNHTHKSFSIEFAGLHFINPKANIYQYKLVGFDKDWINVDATRRVATYSNLSAGKYIFIVRSANGDGVWGNSEAKMNIIIKPPWWNTIWAYILYSVTLLTILYWIYIYIVSKERLKNQIRYEKMKAKKIIELDQLKIQFFTNVSHELRTPLTLLIDPLRKLQGGEVEQSRLSYYYALMYKNAQRLMKLVNQLLDFRKIESNKYILETEFADIASFIGNVADAFRINAMHRNIKFQYITKPSKIMTHFDPDKIEKIIFNLLSNAFKYTPDGREIKLILELKKQENEIENESKDYIIIRVIDGGIGIPKNSVNKIFDVFYQAKLPVGYESEGTGIGLALTKELVELLKGKINVESEENKGSTFIVELPTGKVELNSDQINTYKISQEVNYDKNKDEPMEVGFNIEIEKINRKDFDKTTLLIIEDNPDVRNYLKGELIKEYNILEAVNGYDGLKEAIKSQPDLIISDIMMPVMDGLEFCKKLKTDQRVSHIPVVLLTARHSNTYVIDGYEIGADAYITKPFNTNILKARIKNLIETRKKLIKSFGKSPFIDMKKIVTNATDEDFLNKAIDIIHEYISEPEFKIDLLADNLKINRRQLTHKIKTLTGQTVNEFVKTIRLNKAAELLLTTDNTVSEIAFQLGYNVPANFSRSFNKQFGKSPTDYIASFLNNEL